jgi:hypothetical protein
MTATVPTLDTETDRRKLPGDGKLHPLPHIVRIVVVVPPSDSGAESKSGPSQSDSLTLPEAEALLRGMDPPPSPDGTSAPQESLSAIPTKPKNMFEALKPTDIVVVGREPASVRTIDSSDKPVSVNPINEASRAPLPSGQPSRTQSTRELCAHDDRNRDTVLRVWTESDTIEYQCDVPFEIVRVNKAGWKIYDAPDDPFGNSKDGYKAHIRDAEGENQRPLWVWTSGLLPARANNQQYKMTFKIGDEEIDPDVVCGDPPPSP